MPLCAMEFGFKALRQYKTPYTVTTQLKEMTATIELDSSVRVMDLVRATTTKLGVSMVPGLSIALTSEGIC